MRSFVLYGDPAHPLRPLLMRPYCGARLSKPQHEFNEAMSCVCQAVEWGFGKVVSLFAFLDLKKKSQVTSLGCRTNVQGSSNTNKLSHQSLWKPQYFNVQPPLLEDYLSTAL